MAGLHTRANQLMTRRTHLRAPSHLLRNRTRDRRNIPLALGMLFEGQVRSGRISA